MVTKLAIPGTYKAGHTRCTETMTLIKLAIPGAYNETFCLALDIGHPYENVAKLWTLSVPPL